ncbi:MAG: tRNA (guanosine(46)-N7)-methyltransferase TrmB [Rickettsia endosymbiont of Ixodes persulcatus]|nr:tRNA (guanosine(46)-N7)-methyltransferase TrmB [Rickettsia endosymbiont of Ixodes persulcatus]
MNSVDLLKKNKPLILRPIRSFVHRQVGLSKERERALNTLLTLYTLPVNKGLLNLEQCFQRPALITLEIGFGMGQNLLEQARRHPEKNFLGIEVHRPGIASVLLGIERLKLHNVKIIQGDAVEALNTCIPNKCLDNIQIFFPDPWPKRRHHKRRLIQLEFATLLQAKLKAGGQLQLATDWQDYAEHMLSVLGNTDGLKNQAGKNQFSSRLTQRSPTKFEKRGQQLGHLIWDLAFYSIK